MPAVINESSLIRGVYLVQLQLHEDGRGRFLETFRKEWFPQRSWERVQTNRSDSRPGVLRGLHYHFHQVDYWIVVGGQIRAALFDIRPDSPTFQASQIVTMGQETPIGLLIPVGVAHGFAAMSEATLTYIVDNYHDSSDEFGVAWNDPIANLDWGVTEPVLSGRDQQNPCLSAIPLAHLPRYQES